MIGFDFWSKIMKENADNGNRKVFAHLLSLIAAIVVIGILAYMSEPFTIDVASVVWHTFVGIAILGMVFYAANALEHFADAYKERGLPSLKNTITKMSTKNKTTKVK
jgi:hypothetical protein